MGEIYLTYLNFQKNDQCLERIFSGKFISIRGDLQKEGSQIARVHSRWIF